jgi:hypothetical protein
MASATLRTVLSPLLSREERAIWITRNSYVSLDDAANYRHEKQFRLLLRNTNEHDDHHLSIHSSKLEEAIICLDYLVGLNDTHFQQMDLTYMDGDRSRLCPFGADIVEKILKNSTRRISFNYMIFTPDHCRTLASSGAQTNIEFVSCQFQDGGAAFVEASAARQDKTSGPAKLCFVGGSNPFNDRNWSLFLSQHKLESLILCIDLNSEVSCRAVASAEVRCLTLVNVKFEDEGVALVESVRQGRGPKELCFYGNPFGFL